MRRLKFGGCLFALMILTSQLYAATSPDTISVSGNVSKPGDWTVPRIKTDLASDLTTITYTAHGQKHTADVVPLLSLLEASGVPTQFTMTPHADPKTKNSQLRLAIVVQASDGYAEDTKLARWVHAVQMILVVNIANPTTQSIN